MASRDEKNYWMRFFANKQIAKMELMRESFSTERGQIKKDVLAKSGKAQILAELTRIGVQIKDLQDEAIRLARGGGVYVRGISNPTRYIEEISRGVDRLTEKALASFDQAHGIQNKHEINSKLRRRMLAATTDVKLSQLVEVLFDENK